MINSKKQKFEIVEYLWLCVKIPDADFKISMNDKAYLRNLSKKCRVKYIGWYQNIDALFAFAGIQTNMLHSCYLNQFTFAWIVICLFISTLNRRIKKGISFLLFSWKSIKQKINFKGQWVICYLCSHGERSMHCSSYWDCLSNSCWWYVA